MQAVSSVEDWNRLLRTARFLYANFCVAGRKVGQGLWQVSPQGMLEDLKAAIDATAIYEWLSKKKEPYSEDVRQRLSALQSLLSPGSSEPGAPPGSYQDL
ncbi:MAG: hypothetical protein FIA90_10730 [candidate division NC10 bacterium]|nr:hypothetical protein [Candidatus Methylomirabilis sp.]NJD69102.1 hypothetical protein [candidate division NC10 bacterium]HBY94141.1 hypothetical protein [Chloroflexota bacterium]